ncbi:MAG: 3-deoxy-manno-octulosonate cytidylyltransferase [Pirellulales bacterium]
MTSFIVIPARLASTRLPRKLLLRETGKPLIQHTYESAATARRPSGLCVATDHEDIFNAVRAFGGAAEMTSADCASGTDRVAEVARSFSRRAGATGIDIVVNVQGDEPELPGSSIDAAIAVLEANPGVGISTLAAPIRKREQLLDPSCVKVVFDGSGRAMYFSRSPIPHAREWQDELLAREPPCFYQHIGLYAYRRDFLLDLAAIPASRLEQLEKLEQLRFLEAGHTIVVAVVEKATAGIDTPHDYRAFVERVLAR